MLNIAIRPIYCILNRGHPTHNSSIPTGPASMFSYKQHTSAQVPLPDFSSSQPEPHTGRLRDDSAPRTSFTHSTLVALCSPALHCSGQSQTTWPTLISFSSEQRGSRVLYYYSDLKLSQKFQPMAAQLSMKAALPLAEILAIAPCRCSNNNKSDAHEIIRMCPIKHC